MLIRSEIDDLQRAASTLKNDSTVINPLVQSFPSQLHGLESPSLLYEISLRHDLNFTCPNEGLFFFAFLHATAKNLITGEKIHLNFAKQLENSPEDHIIGFTLACPSNKIPNPAIPKRRLCAANPSTHQLGTESNLPIASNQKRRREQNDQNCPALYPAEKDILFNFTEEFWKQKSAETFNVIDQWANINPFRASIKDTDCIARKGYHDGYFSKKYYDEDKKAVDNCVASCEGGCQLVFGGTSQGGAQAYIAGIDFVEFNPEVITFGAPRPIVDIAPCKTANETRHYRFLNTGGHRVYDYAPFQINIYNERHIGWPIFLDNLGNFPLATPGLKDNRSRFMFRMHDFELYTERLNAITNRKCFPMPVARWVEGHPCTYDDECQSKYCEEKFCREGLIDLDP